MILYFMVCTVFTAGPNIKWDVLHALQFCTGRYSYGRSKFLTAAPDTPRAGGATPEGGNVDSNALTATVTQSTRRGRRMSLPAAALTMAIGMTDLGRSSSGSGDRSPDRPPTDLASMMVVDPLGCDAGGASDPLDGDAGGAFDPLAAWAVADHACKSAESALQVGLTLQVAEPRPPCAGPRSHSRRPPDIAGAGCCSGVGAGR